MSSVSSVFYHLSKPKQKQKHLTPRILFYLLLLSLPLSFEMELANGWSIDIPDEPLMLLVSLIALGTLAYDHRLLSREQISHPLFILLACWIGWIGITVILSLQPLLSLKYLLAKSWYLGAFVLPVLIWGDRKTLRNLVTVLLVSMLCVTCWVLVRHAGDDFSFATVNEAVQPLFRNHVNYSAMLVCMLPILVGVWSLVPSRNQKIFYSAVILLLLFALFFAYARGAWLALLAGIIGYWLIRRRVIVQAYVLAIVFVGVAFFWLKKDDRYLEYAPHYKTTIFHPDFKEHLIATYTLKDMSTAERFYRWIAAAGMVSDKPLTGTGPNTFYPEYFSYTVPAYKTWVSNNPERSGVHNYFLLLAVEQGLPGMVLFLLIAGTMLYHSQRAFHRHTDPFNRVVALSAGTITVMILVLNFLSDLIETDKVGTLFFLCIGILIRLNSSDPRAHVQGVSQPVSQ